MASFVIFWAGNYKKQNWNPSILMFPKTTADIPALLLGFHTCQLARGLYFSIHKITKFL